MSSCHEKTRSPAGVDRPVLVIINVDVSSKHGEKGMGQGAALTIKHVIVAMIARLEFDLNLRLLVWAFLCEFQRSRFFPDPKGLRDSLVHPFFSEAFWVFCYLVGEVLILPARSLQDVTFPSFQGYG